MTDVVAIVDYHAGNLTSVQLAVQKLGWVGLVTNDPAEVCAAPRLIFPGVGAAGAAMTTLMSTGLADAVCTYAQTGRPMLGICLGAQIILDESEEDDVACLGLIPGRVRRLDVPDDVKVPHMGWNEVQQGHRHPIWEGIEDRSQFYFVHSFAPAPEDKATVVGFTEYHDFFVSALAKDNIVATQFHPERSGRVGLQLLGNFLNWNP